MPKMRDDIDMMVHGEVSSPPIATLLGFTITSVGHGEAVIAFEATARHANPMGTLHGGVLCDIADKGNHLVARASSTCMTLRGQRAEGR